MKGWNILKTWWSGGTSAATDESTSASGFIENLVAQPGEVIEDASSLFADFGAEDAVALLVLAKLRKRGGSNCTQSACGGAVATSFHTYDGWATLYHTQSGSIHSFDGSGLLTDATHNASNLFYGTNGICIGDARGRILHVYKDDMARHGVSRLRLSDIKRSRRLRCSCTYQSHTLLKLGLELMVL